MSAFFVQCINNKWDYQASCYGKGCVDAVCNNCIDGEKSCAYQNEEICGDYDSCVTICQNNEWIFHYECYTGVGCLSGVCICEEIAEGATRCGKSNECNNFPCLMECTNQIWEESDQCSGDTPTCSIVDGNGQCVGPCDQDDTKCSTSLYECTKQYPLECILTCTDNIWNPTSSCYRNENGELLDQDCVENPTQCQ